MDATRFYTDDELDTWIPVAALLELLPREWAGRPLRHVLEVRHDSFRSPAFTALLRGFDKRFPGHRDTPGVIFLGARLLSEQSRQHEKAARLLRAVLHHFPDHAVAEEAAVYLKVLEKVMAARPTAA